MAGRLQRKRHIQLDLNSARRTEGKHGGWRPRAGRKRVRGAISHSTRPAAPARFPRLVTLRLVDNAPYLATDLLIRHIHQVIAKSQRASFRIVEFNILGNHIHLIVEVTDKAALAVGMQGFEIRLVRYINTILCRRGSLFAHRYHSRALTTPREVRNALRYVLLNRKHHAAEKRFQRNWIDPWSSAAWFDGWSRPLVLDSSWKRELVGLPNPTAKASTWLLTVGWRRWGPIDFDDRPS